MTSAIALLVLVCSLGVQAREAAELHVRCAEHGELMHVRAIAPAAHDAKTTLAMPGSQQVAAHDHCLVVGASHCAPHAAPAAAIVTAAAPQRAPLCLVPVRLARATYRIAPKTSPPA